jgi:hypothetical protein
MIVGCVVPSVRPWMLEKFLASWVDNHEWTAAIRLHVCAQGYTEGHWRAKLDDAEALPSTAFSWSPDRAPVFPVRVAAMLAHPEVDVWTHADDDMELIPGLTDWRPAIDRVAEDESVGVVSCNFARHPSMLDRSWPPRDPLWIKTPITYMSGGMVYGRRVVDALRDQKDTPWMFDDVAVSLAAYVGGYDNWKYRGSLCVHRTVSAGGNRVTFAERDLPKPDPALLTVRPCPSTIYKGNAAGNNVYMPENRDLTAEAHRLHKEHRRDH